MANFENESPVKKTKEYESKVKARIDDGGYDVILKGKVTIMNESFTCAAIENKVLTMTDKDGKDIECSVVQNPMGGGSMFFAVSISEFDRLWPGMTIIEKGSKAPKVSLFGPRAQPAAAHRK